MPPAPAPGCAVSSLPILIEPPHGNQFPRPAASRPNAPRPVEAPAAGANERRLGVAPGGGYFGLKGIYVLTADGMLHEQVMTTGADFAPPVKFLPAADASPFGLNFEDKNDLHRNRPWLRRRAQRSFGRSTWLHPITTCPSYPSQRSRPLALTGPVLTPDGNSIVVTGAGTSDPTSGVYAGSVISRSRKT